MVNKNKIKGTTFERQIAEELTDLIDDSEWKRIAGSGALGTVMHEPGLVGDVKGKIDNFPFAFRGECKAGYNNSVGKEVKQFTLKKEWLDKIAEEASQSNALPIFFGKFENARFGVKHFVVLDIRIFAQIINEYLDLKKDFDKIFTEKMEKK